MVTSPGFEDRETYISIGGIDIVKDIQLFPAKAKDLGSVELSAKKYNPGRDIMLKVVDKRDQMNLWNHKHKVDVYIKATEKIDRKAKQENTKKDDDPLNGDKKPDWTDNYNLVEVQLNRSYAPVNSVKEVRNAYTLRGKDYFLYYTTTVKSNFNFFENLLQLDDLHENPIMSPISVPGILSYRYKLEEKIERNGQKISKIKIIPRNVATTTLEGYIYVIDSLWLIEKLELTLNKGNLKRYDYFTIEQTFSHPGDSLCLLEKQIFKYGGTYGGEKSNCVTEAVFSNYDFEINFNKNSLTMKLQ